MSSTSIESSSPGHSFVSEEIQANWTSHNSKKIIIMGICLMVLAISVAITLQIDVASEFIQKHTWEYFAPIMGLGLLGVITFAYLVFRKPPEVDDELMYQELPLESPSFA